MRTLCTIITLIASTALLASTALVGTSHAAPHTLMAYGKAGGLFHLRTLGPHASIRLGAGYIPPMLKGRLAAVIDLGYSQTTTEDTIDDPRVGEGAGDARFSYTMTQHDLNLFLGPQVFFLEPRNWIAPFAAAGLDLHFLKSVTEGTGGQSDLGENSEVSTKAGFALRVGAGYRLGPGALTGEVAFSWAPIDHDITGDSHLGRISVLLGYTAMFRL